MVKNQGRELEKRIFQESPGQRPAFSLERMPFEQSHYHKFAKFKRFYRKKGINLDVESYRPFLKKQLELSRRKDALVEDNELFTAEAEWIDQIKPLEFEEAKQAKQENRHEDYILRTLEGIAKLYSDKAILSELAALVQDYPKAEQLAQGYRQLMDLRDQSGADDESLKKLRATKEAWEKDLLQVDIEP